MMYTARSASSGPASNNVCRSTPSISRMVDVQPAVDLADVVDRHDVRIVQPCRGAGFAAEPLLEVGVLGVVGQQHLQRHHPVDLGVVGAPHLAHPAAAKQLDQLVAAKRRPLHRLTISSQSLLLWVNARADQMPGVEIPSSTQWVGWRRGVDCSRDSPAVVGDPCGADGGEDTGAQRRPKGGAARYLAPHQVADSRYGVGDVAKKGEPLPATAGVARGRQVAEARAMARIPHTRTT